MNTSPHYNCRTSSLRVYISCIPRVIPVALRPSPFLTFFLQESRSHFLSPVFQSSLLSARPKDTKAEAGLHKPWAKVSWKTD